MNILIAFFIIITCAIVGLLAVLSHATGVPVMMGIVIGCIIGFGGGFVLVAKELS